MCESMFLKYFRKVDEVFTYNVFPVYLFLIYLHMLVVHVCMASEINLKFFL